jgi:predicted amidohydrolase
VNPQADVLRVALVQTAPHLGEAARNLAELDDQLGRLAESDLAVTPELALHGYHLSTLENAEALTAQDERMKKLGRHGPAVVVGFAESWRHHRYNSAALIDGDQVAAVQRKLYLPTYRAWEERKHFRPGNRLHCTDVRGTRVAILICNDLWQPPLPWLAAHDGAEILVVIANSVESRAAVPVRRAWDLLIAHAAVTLQCYVVFVNRSGDENGQHFWGGSHVAGPDGSTFAHLREEPGDIQAELDLGALRDLRRHWPLLQESRFNLVAREASRLAIEEG